MLEVSDKRVPGDRGRAKIHEENKTSHEVQTRRWFPIIPDPH